MKFELINRTDFPTTQLKEIVEKLLKNKKIPSFYLICQTPRHDGLSVTNLDKPLIIIDIENLQQFEKTFIHELTHLQQHTQDYADEDFDKEVVVTDRHKPKEDAVPLQAEARSIPA